MPHSTEYVKITGFSARRRLSRQVLSPGPSSRCSSHTSAASVGSLIDKPTCWIQLASASEQKTSCILTSLKHPQRSGSAMGDQRELAHISGTANDSAPMGYHLSKPIKHEAQLHQEGKSSLAGAGHAPQQADLQQVCLCRDDSSISHPECLSLTACSAGDARCQWALHCKCSYAASQACRKSLLSGAQGV